MEKDEKIEYISEEGSEDAVKRIEKLRKILKKYKSEKQEYLEGWQRARADFQNYRKQQENVMDEFRKFVGKDFILRILPILDNLSHASALLPDGLKDDPWAKGVQNVQKQFAGILSELGLEEIGVNKGDKFDPMFHEAVGEAEGEGASGTVAEVSQKGYMLNGKAIRAARVKVIK